ncbi:dTDP-4-dehydrorhamnose 3,5-epimerase [Phreatobacter stygius]|uniref:dTDP-4-dehydrorhamnose 3,5-epimerase n=1 Tax=Phreatobacter stygius TaxID=1940610 RepID=A0A4D7B869_9HYPH|nr:dTDP-4-dehydrorhamnose 3,5-epimerase [Phreatobacter stygius]QCI69321.1 dTDP-4-dehydrorhamnose 3,5-epimerase [Phreatobacter stygius]
MEVQWLAIPDVGVIRPRRLADARGYFSEAFVDRLFRSAVADVTFVQDNHALSRDKGVIRGLHFQRPPHAQGKLVRCTRGRILDVAVDIRSGSPTYGKHVSAEISAENGLQIWIPAGFAHGYCTLETDTEISYKVTDYYAPDCDAGLAFDDPALGIGWPTGDHQPILSARDRTHPCLAELGDVFSYSGPSARP